MASLIPKISTWLRIIVVILLSIIPHALAQFNFGSLYDFDLVSDVMYPVPGKEVTLSCTRTEQYQRKSSNSFLNEDNVISWEVNESPVLTTSLDKQGRCKIGKPTDSSILGRPGFGQSRPLRLPNASCSDDGVTIKLILHQWSPLRIAGDVWRCLEFPFAESAKLDLQSFVPVTNVAIKQVIDNGGQYSESRGTIVTCRTSACRPRASIDWFLQPEEGGAIRLTSSLREQVTTNRNELSVTTSAILFNSDLDHGKLVYCTSSNMAEQGDQAPVTSRNITVRVKYPPTVTVYAEPTSSVLEGSDVSLVCDAIGRPLPKVTWVKVNSKKDAETAKSDVTLVSLSATFDLESVRVTDSGTYTCTATNGLEPNASSSLVLYVREAATLPPELTMDELGPAEEITSGGGDSSSGAIAGGVIAALAVVALIVVLIFFIFKHRRKEERFLERLSAQRSIDGSEGQGTYATCSTLPRQSLNQLPPYLELLPPAGGDFKVTNVSNPGYGSNDMIIASQNNLVSNQSGNSKRPLPDTPLEHCDTEYDYIDDSYVLGAHTAENAYLKLQAARTASDGANSADADGYEIPVKPREKNSAEVNKPIPASRQRVPVRAQTVHTTAPRGKAGVSGSKGRQQSGRNRQSSSSSGPPASRSSSKAGNRKPSQDFCFNDTNYDTSF